MAGLGLTGGILDAFTYGNTLVHHLQGGESDEILTRCANARREIWRNNTNPTSEANLLRLCSTEETQVKEREEFFHRLRIDPEFVKSLRTRMYDMLPETFAAA